MRELALHILDLMENALTAGATVIEVSVTEDFDRDLLEIAVEDNGPGLDVPQEWASDPFYTTKPGKKTGLGLSLLRFRAEQAGGRMTVERSALGGMAVRAAMGLSHVDRSPLGDLGATLSAVACTNEGVDLRVRIRAGPQEWSASSVEIARELGGESGPLVVASRLGQRIQEGLTTLRARQ